jgi:hypothetical protein
LFKITTSLRTNLGEDNHLVDNLVLSPFTVAVLQPAAFIGIWVLALVSLKKNGSRISCNINVLPG